MSIVYNPLDDTFQVTQQSVARAAYVAEKFICATTVAVGDLVLVNTQAGDNFVATATNNLDARPVIGIVVRKLEPTTALVLLLGVQSGFSGLQIGYPVYLSATGGLTQSATSLTSGYQQVLGTAVSSTHIFFVPNAQRTVLG